MNNHILTAASVTSSVSDCWPESNEWSGWWLRKGVKTATRLRIISQAFKARLSCVKFSLILFLQCLAGVQEAFAVVEAALIGGNVSQVAVDFSCCQIPKELDDKVTA